MMAIPKAFYMMGSLLGSTMLIAVAALTYWTKAVMVEVGAHQGPQHDVGFWPSPVEGLQLVCPRLLCGMMLPLVHRLQCLQYTHCPTPLTWWT
jgi:hypothetical protein